MRYFNTVDELQHFINVSLNNAKREIISDEIENITQPEQTVEEPVNAEPTKASPLETALEKYAEEDKQLQQQSTEQPTVQPTTQPKQVTSTNKSNSISKAVKDVDVSMFF